MTGDKLSDPGAISPGPLLHLLLISVVGGLDNSIRGDILQHQLLSLDPATENLWAISYSGAVANVDPLGDKHSHTATSELASNGARNDLLFALEQNFSDIYVETFRSGRHRRTDVIGDDG